MRPSRILVIPFRGNAAITAARSADDLSAPALPGLRRGALQCPASFHRVRQFLTVLQVSCRLCAALWPESPLEHAPAAKRGAANRRSEGQKKRWTASQAAETGAAGLPSISRSATSARSIAAFLASSCRITSLIPFIETPHPSIKYAGCLSPLPSQEFSTGFVRATSRGVSPPPAIA